MNISELVRKWIIHGFFVKRGVFFKIFIAACL